MQHPKTTPGDLPASIDHAIAVVVAAARAEGEARRSASTTIREQLAATTPDTGPVDDETRLLDQRRADTTGAVAALIVEICRHTDTVRDAR